MVEIEQYPIIEDWMVPEVTSIQAIPFNKIKEVPDLENYYICFNCRDKDFKKVLNAIPKHSTIAIGSYGCVRSKEEQHSFKVFLEEMLPVLEPKTVVVYGAMPDVVFCDFKDRYTFVRCPAYIDKEMQEVG